ncbi:hypothetical protein ACSF7A_22850, partial [Escherichia coli]
WCPAYGGRDAVLQALAGTTGTGRRNVKREIQITEIMSIVEYRCAKPGAELLVVVRKRLLMNVERRDGVGQSASQPNCRQEEAVCERTKPFQVRSILRILKHLQVTRGNIYMKITDKNIAIFKKWYIKDCTVKK